MSFLVEGLFPMRSFTAGRIFGYQPVKFLLSDGFEKLFGLKSKDFTIVGDDDGDCYPWLAICFSLEIVQCFWAPGISSSGLEDGVRVINNGHLLFSRVMALICSDHSDTSPSHRRRIWKALLALVTTIRMRIVEKIGCRRRFRHDFLSFQHIVLSFKRQEFESFPATLQFFLLNRVM